MSEFNAYLKRCIFVLYMQIRTFYITIIKTLNMCYITIWFCSTQLRWWHAVIAIPSVVLLVAQEVGHMFHPLPVTHFPGLLGLSEAVSVPACYGVRFPVAPVLVSNIVVVPLHLTKCTCAVLAHALWWTHTYMSKGSAALQGRGPVSLPKGMFWWLQG